MIAPVVDVAWLHEHRGEVVVADVRWYPDGRSTREAHAAGHVPGAVWVDLERWLAGAPSPAEGRHPLPSPAVFAEGMARSGIGDTDTVVAYDDAGGVIAARLVWMLRVLGRPAALLDGGLSGWDGPLEEGAVPRPAATFSARPWPAARLASLADAADPATTLLDARDPERYRGDVEPLDAQAGHIPGARNLPARANVEDGRLVDPEELRRRFAAAGVEDAAAGDRVVASCGSGITACHTLLSMEHAGLGHGRLYPGSFSQWSADPARTVATGDAPGAPAQPSALRVPTAAAAGSAGSSGAAPAGVRRTTTLSGVASVFPGGLERVGDGAFAWIQPDGLWGEANAGLVVGDGASVLVDTLWDQALAREMLAAMEPELAGAPIQVVVNTHSDGDHWWGNAEVPIDAEILTSVASLETMREEAPPAGLTRLRALSRRVRRIPGPVGTMGTYVSAMLAPFAFEDVLLRFPDRSFTGRATEAVGGRTLELIEVGPAHTAGDLVVHVPDAGVVFGADVLFFGVTPVMWHGPVENWIAALDLLDGLDADTFVPGHGPVGGRAEIAALRDYWTWLAAGVTEHHAAGRGALDTARALVRDDGFAPFRGWLGPERIVISATTIHRALSGKGRVPDTPPARAKLFAQVATLARELA